MWAHGLWSSHSLISGTKLLSLFRYKCYFILAKWVTLECQWNIFPLNALNFSMWRFYYISLDSSLNFNKYFSIYNHVFWFCRYFSYSRDLQINKCLNSQYVITNSCNPPSSHLKCHGDVLLAVARLQILFATAVLRWLNQHIAWYSNTLKVISASTRLTGNLGPGQQLS